MLWKFEEEHLWLTKLGVTSAFEAHLSVIGKAYWGVSFQLHIDSHSSTGEKSPSPNIL